MAKAKKKRTKVRMVELLLEFCQDIEQTGGVYLTNKGLHAPVADPEWTDIGDLYVKVCIEFDHRPKIVKQPLEDEEDTLPDHSSNQRIEGSGPATEA